VTAAHVASLSAIVLPRQVRECPANHDRAPRAEPRISMMTLLNRVGAAIGSGTQLFVIGGIVGLLVLIAILAWPDSVSTQVTGEAAPVTTPAMQGTGKVVARVNGVEIHEGDLGLALEELGPQVQQLPPAAQREQAITYLADVILLAQAGEDKKFQDTDEFKQRLALLRTKLLMGMTLRAEAQAAQTDAALRAIYDEKVKPLGEQEEVHARHILFRVEKPDDEAASKEAEGKAQAALARLKNGEDFAKVANELTEDPTNRDSGGDLGYFTKDKMVAEFAEPAFKLAKGGLSEPVRTEFGWHLIKVEDRRPRQIPPFDEIKGQIGEFVAEQAQSKLVNSLRAAATIERLDKPAQQ
jgi:peptidyl-prolyl cis-trans isomerase C